MSTNPTYPLNAEHHEARQADVDRTKEKLKAEMSPEERHRLEVVEECAKKLEEAKVPFLLWTSTADKEPKGMPEGYRTWWQFNKMCYLPLEDFERYQKNIFYAVQSLMPNLLAHLTHCLYGSIVVYDEDRPWLLVKEGKIQNLKMTNPDSSI